MQDFLKRVTIPGFVVGFVAGLLLMAVAGTHCLRTVADEDFQESGVTVTIPDGVIVTVALLPIPQPAE